MRCLVLAALVGLGLPLVLVAAPTPAGAAVNSVTTTEDVVDPGDGLASLREVISGANASVGVNDTVVLAAGATYQLDLCTPEANPNNVAGDLDHALSGGLTIQGNGATIEQTCPGERIFDTFGTPLTLQDLTLTGGDHDSGSVLRFAGDLTLDGVEAVDNQGERLIYGTIAALYEVEITDSTFVGQAGNDIAVDVFPESVVVYGSSFRDFGRTGLSSNEAGSPVSVVDSVFVGNGLVDPSVGGGLTSGGSVSVSGSSFVGNQGSNAGAIRSADGGIDADTSTFVDNHVDGFIGGALYSIDLNGNGADNVIELSHVTLWDNTSMPGTSPANLEQLNPLVSFASIIGQPTPGDSCQNGGGTTTSQGFNLDSGDSCGLGAGPGDAENVANIGLGALTSGNGSDEQVLVPGFLSPAVDRIPNGDCVGTIVDQLGQIRPDDGDFDEVAACDVGAVERPLLPVFTDVSAAHPFFEEIGWMGWQQISTGTLPGPAYKPSDAVSRQAMSAFMYRLADASWVGGTPSFSDVGPSNPFFDEIEWMNAADITNGFPGGLFKPTAAVTRQAMSAFMHRYAGAPLGPFPDPGFPDVSAGHPFFLEISWMADAGITEGFDDGTFKPGANVSRQAMSAFMFRFAVLVD